jgi:hypothetical protein
MSRSDWQCVKGRRVPRRYKREQKEKPVGVVWEAPTGHGSWDGRGVLDPPALAKHTLQVDFELIRLARCKHLSGVTRSIGAPKWGIRSHLPLQLVGL